MRLKFIGADGSMGLRYGKTYKVAFKNTDQYIVLTIKKEPLGSTIVCPYGSPQALAKNWSL